MNLILSIVLLLLLCSSLQIAGKGKKRSLSASKRGRTKRNQAIIDGNVNASSSGDIGTMDDGDMKLSTISINEEVLSTVAVGSDEDLRSESNVQLLRSTGHYYLRLKDYKGAAKYYSAILQLYEGIGGSESRDVRRRCCLTLAECEIKMGNFMHAISLCSEVIEEANLTVEITTAATAATLITGVEEKSSADTEKGLDINESREKEKEEYEEKEKENDEQQEIHAALGKAHYRRAMSFLHLNYLHLALLDLQVAHEKLPENESILDHIVDVDEKIKEETVKETAKDHSMNDKDATNVTAKTDAPLNGADVAVNKDKADAVALDELILDIVDESHCLERRRYSPRQLQHLISEANRHKLSGFNTNADTSNSMANPFGDLSSLMGGMPGTDGGLMDLLGSGGASAGGAGGLMSMLAPLAGMAGKGGKGKGFSLPSSETILNMFPTVGSLMGLKPDTIQTSKEILEAVIDVGKFIFGVWKRIKPYKDLVFMAATCLFFWLKIKAKR